jgi:hypothetical protein
MRKIAALSLISTVLALAAFPAYALRCGSTSCGGVVYPPMFAGLLSLFLSE